MRQPPPAIPAAVYGRRRCARWHDGLGGRNQGRRDTGTGRLYHRIFSLGGANLSPTSAPPRTISRLEFGGLCCLGNVASARHFPRWADLYAAIRSLTRVPCRLNVSLSYSRGTMSLGSCALDLWACPSVATLVRRFFPRRKVRLLAGAPLQKAAGLGSCAPLRPRCNGRAGSHLVRFCPNGNGSRGR